MRKSFSIFLLALRLSSGREPEQTQKAGVMPAALEGIQLQDQSGRAIKADSFLRGPVLLNFIFTTCPVACPRQTSELREMLNSLPAEARAKVQIVSVSVDPVRDTPQALRAFAGRMKVDGIDNWRFATGHAAEVKRLLDRLSVMDPSKKNPQPIDHRLTVFLFNKDGLPVIRYQGSPLDKARIAADLGHLVQFENK